MQSNTLRYLEDGTVELLDVPLADLGEGKIQV